MTTTCLESGFGRFQRSLALAISIAALVGQPLWAGESKEPPPATPEEPLTNWITLTIGGVSVDGDEAQFEQRHWTNSGWFGGIEDLHWEPKSGNKDLTIKIDGRAINGIEDYFGNIEISYQNVGYIKTGYSRFRTWYDGNGGFFPFNDQFFDLYNNDFSVDRSDGWIELGLRVPN